MSQPSHIPRLQALFAQGKTYTYARGEAIGSTDQGDIILMLQSGYVKRYMIRNDGALGIQIIYGPQDIFSLTHIYRLLLGQSLYEGPETYYYTAISKVTVLALDTATLTANVQANPLLYRELFSEAGRHLKACVHSIENTSLHAAYPRVAHELSFIFTEFGRAVGSGGSKLDVPLTHQDIADVLGITRATASLAIGKLRQKGLLLPTRCFTTMNLAALTREAYSA